MHGHACKHASVPASPLSCISPRAAPLPSATFASLTGIRILVPLRVTSCSFLLSSLKHARTCMQACVRSCFPSFVHKSPRCSVAFCNFRIAYRNSHSRAASRHFMLIPVVVAKACTDMHASMRPFLLCDWTYALKMSRLTDQPGLLYTR